MLRAPALCTLAHMRAVYAPTLVHILFCFVGGGGFIHFFSLTTCRLQTDTLSLWANAHTNTPPSHILPHLPAHTHPVQAYAVGFESE